MKIINLTPFQQDELKEEFKLAREAEKEGPCLIIGQVFGSYMKVGVVQHKRARIILETFQVAPEYWLDQGLERVRKRYIPDEEPPQ